MIQKKMENRLKTVIKKCMTKCQCTFLVEVKFIDSVLLGVILQTVTYTACNKLPS